MEVLGLIYVVGALDESLPAIAGYVAMPDRAVARRGSDVSPSEDRHAMLGCRPAETGRAAG
jgi:hypothetical protein